MHVELLLNAGADVSAQTVGRYKHYTALHAAVDSKNILTGAETELTPEILEGPDRCIELLLNAGADVNVLTGGPGEHVSLLFIQQFGQEILPM